MNLDTYYSPEVEEALVTLVWHKSELLGRVLQQIDPSVHIMQDHLRFILEAIQLSQDMYGATDFATVVQALRDDNRFEACGELLGLDAIFNRNYGYESLLSYYIELLKTYAAKRQTGSSEPVVIFSGGKGTLHLNKDKDNDKDPDYIGQAFIRARKYKWIGWISRDNQAIHCSLYAS